MKHEFTQTFEGSSVTIPAKVMKAFAAAKRLETRAKRIALAIEAARKKLR